MVCHPDQIEADPWFRLFALIIAVVVDAVLLCKLSEDYNKMMIKYREFVNQSQLIVPETDDELEEEH